MKRIVIIVTLAAAVVVPAASASAPRLAITRSTPLTVSGSHFKAHEQVTVTFGPNKRYVRTTALGTFQASFPGVLVDRCSSWSITAVDAVGDHAVLIGSHLGCEPA
jgi:hypothetical protein